MNHDSGWFGHRTSKFAAMFLVKVFYFSKVSVKFFFHYRRHFFNAPFPLSRSLNREIFTSLNCWPKSWKSLLFRLNLLLFFTFFRIVHLLFLPKRLCFLFFYAFTFFFSISTRGPQNLESSVFQFVKATFFKRSLSFFSSIFFYFILFIFITLE